jgi:two-component system phosphate regulon sensor histidine kinase PhoR
MRIHRLSLFAAVILTIAMATVALLFNHFQLTYPESTNRFYFYLLLSILIITLINYFVLEFLFNSYGKKQIKKISDILPEEIVQEEERVDFKELGERIQKNVTEIDVLKQMENYRKEYMGNVSHEMKTPLFSIQGYLSTLIDGGVENLEIRDKYLLRIENSVERLLNIVKDLDMINKYESGEISIVKTKFEIYLLIKEVLDLLDLEAQKKHAKLVLKSPNNHLMVLADKQKISQVLINLVSNAISYANRENAVIEISTKPLGNLIEVTVKDNGMGIKPEILPRIFERFYRVESSRNRKDGGSGLGLAIVKHILEAHQQTITAESQYLEGTTFRFYLEKAL